MKRFAWLIAAVVFLGAGPSVAESDQTMVVGRVTEIADGELLRYDADAGEWVALVPDAPFGIDDALYTDDRARAEILIPNGTLVRLDRGTRILTLSLEERLTLLQLSEGLMRVISRPDGAEIEIQTVFGGVRVPSGGAADIALDDQGGTATAVDRVIEVLTLRNETYRIQPGESLSFSDHRVDSAAAPPNPSWAEWNGVRDQFWAARSGDNRSVHYLPAPLATYAYDLDAYGEWRQVYYSGAYRWLWHPTRVATGWAPFTCGRWVTWYGDPCWFPAEPFGFVTHHYGSWEYLGGIWLWVPPGLGITVSLGTVWYPGRVGWVSYGGFIGWYPLLWNEPWYARRRWGPHSRSYDGYRRELHYQHSRAVIVENRYFYHDRTYVEHRNQPGDPRRFSPLRGPQELTVFYRDPNRFYAKGAPAVYIPPPGVTQVVRQRVEAKGRLPDGFGPAPVVKLGHQPPASPRIGRPQLDSRTEVAAPSIDRPDRAETSGIPNRPDQPARPEIERQESAWPPPKVFPKAMPAPPRRSGGRSSAMQRTGTTVVEKPVRTESQRTGTARQAPGAPLPSPNISSSTAVIERVPASPPPRRMPPPPGKDTSFRRGTVERAPVLPAPQQPAMKGPSVSSPRQNVPSPPAEAVRAPISPPPRRIPQPSVSPPQQNVPPSPAVGEQPIMSSPPQRQRPTKTHGPRDRDGSP